MKKLSTPIPSSNYGGKEEDMLALPRHPARVVIAGLAIALWAAMCMGCASKRRVLERRVLPVEVPRSAAEAPAKINHCPGGT